MEAQFLHSQKQRLLALKERENARRRHWSSAQEPSSASSSGSETSATTTTTATEAVFAKRWAAWQEGLATLQQLHQQQENSQTAPTAGSQTSEDGQRQLRLQFNQLKEILHEQRRLLLEASSSSQHNELSDASLRRWHAVLVAGQGQLDQWQQRLLLPRGGKFVFSRYRKAMAAAAVNHINVCDNGSDDRGKGLNGSHLGAPQLTRTAEEMPSTNDVNHHDNNAKVDGAHSPIPEDLVHALPAYTDGTIRITGTRITFQKDRPAEGETTDDITTLTDATTSDTVVVLSKGETSVPLVWQKLDRCVLHWVPYGDNSTGGSVLHLVHCSNCQLHISVPLRSVHVTDCQGLDLHLAHVQQVRLHASQRIQVWGHVRGGTILEDCRDIGVTVHCPSVHDFSWLRADQPSPNIVGRLSEPDHSASTQQLGPEMAVPASPTQPSTSALMIRSSVLQNDSTNHESDEDEL